MDTPLTVNRRRGILMIIMGWALAFFVTTWFYRSLQQQQYNPNQISVVSAQDGELTLHENRQGHYLIEGSINDETVTFLIDTGATRVAVSEQTAKRLGLIKKQQRLLQTAAGETVGWTTEIPKLQIGFIVFHNLSGVIIGDLDEETILLGMNALGQLHITQSEGVLKLRPIGVNQ